MGEDTGHPRAVAIATTDHKPTALKPFQSITTGVVTKSRIDNFSRQRFRHCMTKQHSTRELQHQQSPAPAAGHCLRPHRRSHRVGVVCARFQRRRRRRATRNNMFDTDRNLLRVLGMSLPQVGCRLLLRSTSATAAGILSDGFADW